MVMGLSGMLTILVRAPTCSPVYSILYRCTIFVIITYSSILANRCPIQDLFPCPNGR